MQDQCKYNQYVFLLIFMANTEAKHKKVTFPTRISHFRCFVTTHKLNFEFTSQTYMICHSRPQASLLGRTEKAAEIQPSR